jgi:hypothetical protein
MKRVLTAVIALVTVAAASGGPKAAEPCSELRQASNSATMQVPAGAMVSEKSKAMGYSVASTSMMPAKRGRWTN